MSQKRYVPRGNENHNEQLEVSNVKVEDLDRRFITKYILIILTIVVVGVLAFSLIFDDSNILEKLLNFLQTLLAMIIAYYFGKDARKYEKI